MSDEIVIVLDAGTGGGRAVAVDKTGKVRAYSYRQWSYFEPPGLEMIANEFTPDEFRAIIAERCREVMERIDPASVIAVTATSMREGCVFLDEDGRALYGGSNRDARGILYASEVEELLGKERVYTETGHWPPFLFMPARLYWFREDAPEIRDKIAGALMINDWLIRWLSGKAVGEPTNAGESMLFNIDRREWSEEMLKAAGVDRSILPPVEPCGTVVGEITEAASNETDIPAGTSVVTGVADTQAGLLAGKVSEPGEVGIVAGSTAPLMMVVDKSVRDPEYRLWHACHALPDKWVAESNTGDAGLIYRWYVERHYGAMAPEGTSPYDAIEELAEDAGLGAWGARAFLGPMIWDLKSVTLSAKSGLFLTYPVGGENSSPGVFARAILENVAFALRGNLDQVKEVTGITPTRFALAGGMTRSKVFCEVVANVLGAPVEVVPEPEATAVGCAIMAFAAKGVYPGVEAAMEAMVGDIKAIEPDEDDQDEYTDIYEEWLEEYPKMMGLDDD